MKAIIFNSGIGKRMGEFTLNNHKSMAVLYDGRTIFERQIDVLSKCGIKEFVITTGPFKNQLVEVCEKFPNLIFQFVDNPIYDKTNYIYSMYLASEYFDDDCLVLHGDLVFNKELVLEMIKDKRKSICLINKDKDLPLKDFKARVKDGKLMEVSINIFDDDCYAFQPLYKLSKSVLLRWYSKVKEFVEFGEVSVYAENALNTILNELEISVMSYSNHYIDEVDNLEDLERVNDEIKEFDKKLMK